MSKFAFGMVIGIIALPLGALLYIWLGYAPVATAAPPFPLEKKLASMALRARIAKEAPKTSAIPATPEMLLAGAHAYRDHCAVCHGMSTGSATATAKGMYQPPPKLLQGKGVTDDPVGITYWKIANGIRLTGMPAYGGSLSDVQIWQISQLLAHAHELPASVHEIVASAPPAQ